MCSDRHRSPLSSFLRIFRVGMHEMMMNSSHFQRVLPGFSRQVLDYVHPFHLCQFTYSIIHVSGYHSNLNVGSCSQGIFRNSKMIFPHSK